MTKLDELIEYYAYTLDCLIELRRIYETHCCNDCARAKWCEYVPKVGQQVRYNCPHYVGGEAG